MQKMTRQKLLETARQHVLGYSNKEIGENLDVSTVTARKYLKIAEEKGYLKIAEDERQVVYELMWEKRRTIADLAFTIVTKRLEAIIKKDEVDSEQLEEALKALDKTEHIGKNLVPTVTYQQNNYITPEAINNANKASEFINTPQTTKVIDVEKSKN